MQAQSLAHRGVGCSAPLLPIEVTPGWGWKRKIQRAWEKVARPRAMALGPVFCKLGVPGPEKLGFAAQLHVWGPGRPLRWSEERTPGTGSGRARLRACSQAALGSVGLRKWERKLDTRAALLTAFPPLCTVGTGSAEARLGPRRLRGAQGPPTGAAVGGGRRRLQECDRLGSRPRAVARLGDPTKLPLSPRGRAGRVQPPPLPSATPWRGKSLFRTPASPLRPPGWGLRTDALGPQGHLPITAGLDSAPPDLARGSSRSPRAAWGGRKQPGSRAGVLGPGSGPRPGRRRV